MEFINRMRYQYSQLIQKGYIQYLMAEIRKVDIPEINYEHKVAFELSLPMEFGKFLSECSIILVQHLDIDFGFDADDVNIDFLMTLIYTALFRDDIDAEIDSDPIQGLVMFLVLNSEKYIDMIDLDDDIFDTIFVKVLDVFKQRILSGNPISLNLMLIWNKFLSSNKNVIDIERVIDLFLLTLTHNGFSLIDGLIIEFQLTLSKITFICFKSIIEIHQSKNQKDIVTMISLKLQETYSNVKNPVFLQNILYFFKHVLHTFCNERWYFPLLVVILKEIKPRELFVYIINQLPVEKYDSFVNLLINNCIQATDIADLHLYLNVINLIIKNPYQAVPDERRQRLVRRILTETFMHGSHSHYEIREHVMELFIDWSQMKDINVRHHMQLMFHYGSKLHFAQLFESLQQTVDLAWKVPSYNITFIVLACRLFMLNRNFISQNRMKIVEVLCYKSTAHCLKPSVRTIMELIKHFALAPHPILKPMLTLILNNALSATTASNYYLKELFNLLVNCMVAEDDSESEFAICNTILSDDFNCLELFKMIRIHNLVRVEHVEILLQEKILKYPCSWKLLTILLESIDYTTCPPFMDHYFTTKMNSAAFFTSPESVYMLQVMTKIFTAKIKNGTINGDDVKLANTIDKYLANHIRDLAVPPKEIGDALILLLTVNKITHVSMNWVSHFFIMVLDEILDKLYEPVDEFARLPLARHIIYLEQMLLYLDVEVEQHSINRLLCILNIEDQQAIPHEQVYASIVSFTGKLCLKYHDRLNEAVPLLQFALLNGPPPVQLMSMSTLYDISNLRLSYFDPLYSGLLKLIKSDTVDVKNMAVKMLIKLVNDAHIRLTCNDFITLILVLIDRNYKLCLYFIDLLENDFIHRNQHTISKYFIHLLFYLNKYREHERYFVTLTDCIGNYDFTYERRIIIYKFLFCNLERQCQMQILNVLNTDYLTPFYNGRVNIATNTLNVLRDILTLTCFNSSQYVDDVDMDKIDEFFTSLFDDMKRDFFTRKRFAEDAVFMDFDKSVEKLLISLLKLLYKIEKSNRNMLPQFFCTVGLTTRAFYSKVVHLVHGNCYLKNLYYELQNCYTKYKEMVKSEPLDVLKYCDKEEWRLYLG